jgi:preprotein translocase subunit SecG
VESNIKKASPAVFVLALICFFLPFVTFSCQGQKVLTLSGIQLVTGTSMQQSQMFGPPKSEKINAEPLAVLALLCGVLGLGLSFLRGRTSAIAPAAAGGLAAILLLAMKSKIDGDALQKGGGILQVNYEAGFYLVVILFLAAVALNVFVLLQGKGLPLPAVQTGGGSKFCIRCGSKNLSTDASCKACGATLS